MHVRIAFWPMTFEASLTFVSHQIQWLWHLISLLFGLILFYQNYVYPKRNSYICSGAWFKAWHVRWPLIWPSYSFGELDWRTCCLLVSIYIKFGWRNIFFLNYILQKIMQVKIQSQENKGMGCKIMLIGGSSNIEIVVDS